MANEAEEPGADVDWMQQPLRSAALTSIALAVYMAGLAVFIDALCERWAKGEWIGLGIVVSSWVIGGVNSFLEARAGRWIASEAYLADRARSWWARLGRYTGVGVLLAVVWGSMSGWFRGVSAEGYPAYLNWYVPGFVVVTVVLRVVFYLCQVWCEGISVRVREHVPTTWIVRPLPVVTWSRRAIGFGGIAAGCAYLVLTAPPKNQAAPIVEKVMLVAIAATVVCTLVSRSASTKHGATRRVVQ